VLDVVILCNCVVLGRPGRSQGTKQEQRARLDDAEAAVQEVCP